jgi:hypothetical protein
LARRRRRGHYNADCPEEQRLLKEGFSDYRQAAAKSEKRKGIVAQWQRELQSLSPQLTLKAFRMWFNNAVAAGSRDS